MAEERTGIVFQTQCSWLAYGKWRGISLAPIWHVELAAEPEVVVFGKKCRQRRNVGFFSDDVTGYRYSGYTAIAKPLSPFLNALLAEVNKFTGGDNFNALLINEYVDGKHYIGAHSDDEKTLGDSGVFTLSCGATRTLRIRDKTTRRIVFDLELHDHTYVQMGGKFQAEFTHEIVGSRKIHDARRSITCRKHNI